MPNKKHAYYEELESLKKRLGEQAAKLRGELKAIEEKVSAVDTTMQLLKCGSSNALTKSDANPYLREFRGLTQVQGMVKMARDSGNNRFKIKEAKKLLFEAGLVKSQKNAGTILFTAIQRSEKFKRVAPGEYEVIEAKTPATGIKITQIA